MAENSPPPTEVAGFDQYGSKVMVTPDQVPVLEGQGGRVAKPEEIARDVLAAEYKARPFVEKVAGNVLSGPLGIPGTAPDLIRQGIQAATGLRAAAPQVEALNRGLESGATAGLMPLITKAAIGAVGGEKAATAYKEEQEKLQLAHGTAYGAGEGVGMLLTAPALGGLGALGESAGLKVAGGLAKSEAVLARAATTGLKLAGRGAIENAAYTGVKELSGDLFADRPVTGEKIAMSVGMAALTGGLIGGGLGVAGSLAASGAKGAASGLSRVIGESEGVKPWLKKQANALAIDSLTPGGSAKAVVRDAFERVDGGYDAGGEWLNRRVLSVVGEEASIASKSVNASRVDQLLPRIQQELAKDGEKIGAIYEKYGTEMVHHSKVFGPGFDLVDEVTKNFGAASGKALKAEMVNAWESLQARGAVTPDGLMSARDVYTMQKNFAGEFFDRRSIDAPAQKVVGRWLMKVKDEAMQAVERTSKAMGQESVIDELKLLNKEYSRGSGVLKVAKNGVAQLEGNNTIPLTAWIAGAGAGTITGPLGQVAATFATRAVKQRGSAVGAMLLTKLADSQALTQAAARIDGLVTKAARGIVEPASGGVARAAATSDVRAQAAKIITIVNEQNRNPYRIQQQIEKHAEGISKTSPSAASAYVTTASAGIRLLQNSIPKTRSLDPLDPKSTPQLTQTQAAKLVRTAEYIDHPEKILEDLHVGRITPEAVEVAKAMIPQVYAQLQRETLSRVTDKLAKGHKIPYAQRLKLSMLLDVPADASLRPETQRMLQSTASPPPDAAPASGGPVRLKTQQSEFDRIEEG